MKRNRRCLPLLVVLAACATGTSEAERALAIQALLVEPEVVATKELAPAPDAGVVPAAETRESAWRVVSNAGSVADGRVARYVVESDERIAAREASVAARAEHRAFDGAPPTVPHDLTWGAGGGGGGAGAADSCLGCHAKGMAFGERVAHPISHTHLTSCTQCHVAESHPFLPASAPPARSIFAGLPSPGAGERASPVSPPRMPHPTLLRTRCLSCHGEYGYAGLRTAHPTRGSCVQCHTTSASRDQLSSVFR